MFKYPDSPNDARERAEKLEAEVSPKPRCRYCGNGGCKKKVVGNLIVKGNDTQRLPICATAVAQLKVSICVSGNVNSVGQRLFVEEF